jgi:hypothetical protein
MALTGGKGPDFSLVNLETSPWHLSDRMLVKLQSLTRYGGKKKFLTLLRI